jgi:hypothetical protein
MAALVLVQLRQDVVCMSLLVCGPFFNKRQVASAHIDIINEIQQGLTHPICLLIL